MDDVLKFLMDNWQSLVVIALSLVTMLVSIFRRKVTLDIPVEIIDDVLVKLPGWIADAESCNIAGPSKLQQVVNKACEYLAQKLNIRYYKALSLYSDFIESCVENILSTPTKKGISYEKKIK